MGAILYIAMLTTIDLACLCAAISIRVMAGYMASNSNIQWFSDDSGNVIPPLTVVNGSNVLTSTQNTWV